MKKFFVFAILAISSLITGLFAEDILTYTSLNGNVKSYTQTDYTIASKFGNYFRTPSLKITHKFNSDGLEIESSELTPRDVIVNTITTTYDENKNPVQEVRVSSDNEILWKNISTYNNNLKQESSEFDAKDNLKARIIYTYNNDKLLDETGYDGEGAIMWKTVYKYNVNGLKEVILNYNSDGSLSEQQTYTYTDDNKIDTITTFDSFTNTSVLKVFRYAPNGLLNEITYYDSNKEITKRIVVKYDSSNNISKVSEYNVAFKFGQITNELISMSEFSYEF